MAYFAHTLKRATTATDWLTRTVPPPPPPPPPPAFKAGHRSRSLMTKQVTARLRALASDIYNCRLELSDPTAHRVPQLWGRHTAAHDVPVCGEAGIESRSVPLHTTRSCLSVVKQALSAVLCHYTGNDAVKMVLCNQEQAKSCVITNSKVLCNHKQQSVV